MAVDILSKNDLFVNLSFEQAPNGFASNLWKYRSPVRNEAGSQASWEVDGMEHIVTHSDNVKTKKIKFELWDKNLSKIIVSCFFFLANANLFASHMIYILFPFFL